MHRTYIRLLYNAVINLDGDTVIDLINNYSFGVSHQDSYTNYYIGGQNRIDCDRKAANNTATANVGVQIDYSSDEDSDDSQDTDEIMYTHEIMNYQILDTIEIITQICAYSECLEQSANVSANVSADEVLHSDDCHTSFSYVKIFNQEFVPYDKQSYGYTTTGTVLSADNWPSVCDLECMLIYVLELLFDQLNIQIKAANERDILRERGAYYVIKVNNCFRNELTDWVEHCVLYESITGVRLLCEFMNNTCGFELPDGLLQMVFMKRTINTKLLNHLITSFPMGLGTVLPRTYTTYQFLKNNHPTILPSLADIINDYVANSYETENDIRLNNGDIETEPEYIKEYNKDMYRIIKESINDIKMINEVKMTANRSLNYKLIKLFAKHKIKFDFLVIQNCMVHDDPKALVLALTHTDVKIFDTRLITSMIRYEGSIKCRKVLSRMYSLYFKRMIAKNVYDFFLDRETFNENMQANARKAQLCFILNLLRLNRINRGLDDPYNGEFFVLNPPVNNDTNSLNDNSLINN
jgi:hypothetical protein